MSEYAQALDDLLDAQVDIEDSRGYDDEPMGSDIAELVGRLTPSPADDPDWGKTPRQVEREAEAEAEQAGGDVRGVGILELFGAEHGLSDAQRGDLESERARAEELAAEAEAQQLQDNPVEFEYPAEMVQAAEANSTYAQQVAQDVDQHVHNELSVIAAKKAQIAQQRAQVEQAYAAAQQAGDQARMQQCQQAAVELQQQHELAERYAAHQQDTAAAIRYAAEHETAFRATHPDYDAAEAFIARAVDHIAAQQFGHLTAEQRQEVVRVAKINFTNSCRANGINPAQAIFDKAIEVGYQPVQATRKATCTRRGAIGAPAGSQGLPADAG